MCGIFTIINDSGIDFEIVRYLECIKHRGPDDFGWCSWDDNTVQLGKEDSFVSGALIQGHVRLSILDLSPLGWQPMLSECRRYSLCYNGEVYNFVELREELERLGYAFISHSDTEVVLYALIEWKEAAISRFRGMFAFTFFDSKNSELLVVRDHFGIKPLYYTQDGTRTVFASELTQLLLLDGVSNDYNAQMTYDYLLTGATEHAQTTMYKDIKEFPAAHYAKIKLGDSNSISIQRYWGLDLTKSITPSFETAKNKVRELFLKSIKIHMRSDVSIGAALSGGIDSSAIACAIRHLYPDQDIHTFSFIADDKALSEEKWVDIVNSHIGATSHKIRVNREELVADLDDLIKTQELPFGSTSIYAQYRVFKCAKEYGITVMLDGQGADEMLAGYIFFQASLLSGYIRKFKWIKACKFFKSCVKNTSTSASYLAMATIQELLPVKLASSLKTLLLPSKGLSWLSTDWLKSHNLTSSKKFRRKVYHPSPLKGHLKSNLTELGLPHLLRYEDRDSMRWSIESRVPFLYVELVEYLYSLPEEYLLNGEGTSKYVFREAMRGIVPDSILDRKDKIGFATPEQDWLTKLNVWVEGKLSSVDNKPMFNKEALQAEWESVLSGKVKFDFRCWRWLNLISWLDSNEKK